MASISLGSHRSVAGVTGSHRGQCSAAWLLVVVVLLAGSSWAAPTTTEPTLTEGGGNNVTSAPLVAEALNGSSEAGFSCEGRIFGYYGDPSNCSLFHYCEPFADPENNQFVLHAAYLCPNETVFNQLSLTCAYAHEALPCRRAPEYYYINSHVVPADSAAAQQDTQGTTTDAGGSTTAAPATTTTTGDQAATS